MRARRIAVLQPSYLPWLGYLDQMDAVDTFVFYDDVQFDSGGWRNRNRIKTGHGVKWLTVPVTYDRSMDASAPPVLTDMRVAASPWRRKHLDMFAQAYAHRPGVTEVVDALRALYSKDHAGLVDLAIDSVLLCARLLGVRTETLRASDLGVAGGRTERLVGICRQLGGTHYLSGAAARSYLEIDRFHDAGICVEFQDYRHPTYPQPHGSFVPFLSAIDMIANVDTAALEVLREGRRYTLA